MEKRERVVPPILVMFSRTINALRCYFKKKSEKIGFFYIFLKYLNLCFCGIHWGPDTPRFQFSPHAVSWVWFRDFDKPSKHVFRMWEETVVHGENPRTCGGGNTQSSCRKVRAQPGIHHLGVEMWRCYPLTHHALLEILRISTIN